MIRSCCSKIWAASSKVPRDDPRPQEVLARQRAESYAKMPTVDLRAATKRGTAKRSGVW